MVIVADCLVLVALQLKAVAVAEVTKVVGSLKITVPVKGQFLLSRTS